MNYNHKILFLICIFYFSLFSKPAFFINSIPKSGTHLIMELIKNLVPLEILFRPLNDFTALNNKQVFVEHVICNKDTVNLLKGVKGIFIYRDPRDQVVSFAYHVKKYFGQDGENLSIEELISCGISDCSKYHHQIWGSHYNYNNIKELYDRFMGWKKVPSIYLTKFERLVGSKGGGSNALQLAEIQAIAKFLGIKLNNNDAKNIANKLFGSNTVGATPWMGSTTFREGKIGSWKQHFTPAHKKDFKRIAGQLLIELGYEKDLNW